MHARPWFHRHGAEGYWSQNMWLDGTPYWHGIQMDETALPILLVDLAAREGVLDTRERDTYWPMVRRAAAFLARRGPVSPQDRWEEEPGYAPFTVATEIAALLVAAELADAQTHKVAADYLRETADAWNASLESMAVRVGNEIGAAARGRRVLRPCRGTRSGGCRVAVSGICPHQESASRSIDGTGGVDGQP